MQIEPTLARLFRLSFGLSRYFWTRRIAETSLSPLDSAKSLSEITSLFDFSRYLDRSLDSAKV